MSTTEETNPTEVCENCGKEIESYKMILHERFCKINIRKCPECNEPIQIDELEEHKIMKHLKKKINLMYSMLENWTEFNKKKEGGYFIRII